MPGISERQESGTCFDNSILTYNKSSALSRKKRKSAWVQKLELLTQVHSQAGAWEQGKPQKFANLLSRRLFMQVGKYTRAKLLKCGMPMIIFPILLSGSFLSCFVPGTSEAIAAGTETAHEAEISHAHEEGMPCTGECLAKAQSTEAAWLGGNDEVSIATRHETSIGKAPSIITVITGEEIKNMGYRTLIEILRTIPGFELLMKGENGNTMPAIRGLEGTARTRVMLNGHFIGNYFAYKGGAFVIVENFPVESIKKIEVLRGPGSAVYGENAFLSVINIITKDAKDINGVKVSSGYGSFDAKEGNIVFGETYGKVDISGMVSYKETDGFDGIIEKDYQTILDNAIGSTASQAPGKVEDWRREYDLNLKAAYKDVYLQGLYMNKNHGQFTSPQFAVNDESDQEHNYVFVETGYRKTFEERFTLRPRIYYDQIDVNAYVESLPEGTTLPLDTNGDGIYDILNRYEIGVIGNLKGSVKSVGSEIPVDYEVFDGNIITVGLEYRLVSVTNLYTGASFNPGTMEPLSYVKNFSDSYPFQEETTRRMVSAYLQDTWDITDTLNLTLGIRHDRYNDFGNVTSPRAGLTWAFTQDASLKLLYGEAFRVPDFHEMYLTNQPAVQGNKNLDPETIRTYEAGLTYRFNKHVSSGINYFYNDIQDLIVLRTSQTAQNVAMYDNFGDAHVQGIETETKVDICKGNYVFANYTFQNPEDDAGHKLPSVSEHKGNFGVNIHCWKYINTNLSTFVSGKRFRNYSEEHAPSNVYEPRDKLPGYALLNLSVIGKEFFKTMEIQGTVFNLLDKDYSDPGPTSIPDDFPRPGRTFWVGLSYQF